MAITSDAATASGGGLIYLSGCAAYARLEAQVKAGIGLMLTPLAGYRVGWANAVPCWAADNGCFSAGDRFDLAAWYAWLDEMRGARDTCLFAVAPDVIGDAAATRARSLPVLGDLAARGWTPAYVIQDGETVETTPWGTFGALFVGGVDCEACALRKSLPGMPRVAGCRCFKWGPDARAIVAEAKRRGLWVHVGRVNSGVNLLRATRMGADSCDGTYMRFNPIQAVDRMGRWLRAANAPQLALPLEVRP
jgi:hypothetical protein